MKHLIIFLLTLNSTLLTIQAQHGNYIPDPNPLIHQRLEEWQDLKFGLLMHWGWMKINAEAIYEIRAIDPYKEGKVCLTRKMDGATYAIYLGEENEPAPPARIWMSTVCPPERAKIKMLGTDSDLRWEKAGNGFMVEIPSEIRNNSPCNYAWTINLGKIE